MRIMWVVVAVAASVTALVTTGIAVTVWFFWPLLDPLACAKAERDLDAQVPVVASLPPALTVEVRQTNGCDSGDGGYTSLAPDPDLDFHDVDRLLRRAGWTASDPPPLARYEKQVNGGAWHLWVEELRGATPSLYLELS